MADTLSQFGYSFQTKLIASLLLDKEFLEQVSDVIKTEYFDSESNQWIVNKQLEYFEKYRDTMTLNALKIEIKKITTEVEKSQVISSVKDVIRNLKSNDLNYIKDESVKFFKNQEMKNAILQSVDLLKAGSYNDIYSLFTEVMKKGEVKNVGSLYKEDLEQRYNEALRKCIITPWNVINELTDGGIGAGELGCIVGGPGTGKSWLLANIGLHALSLGKKVLHYTLELNESYVGLRYDAILTGIQSQDLKFHKNDVIKKVEQLKGDLTIKEYPTSTVSIQTLYAHIKKHETLRFKPDIIIVDYGDLLATKVTKGQDNSYHIGGNIFEELRGLAGTFRVPVWTASQTQRGAAESEIVEGHQIADSYKKVMISDFIISLSRTVEDKTSGTGRIHVIKNRFGPDGLTYGSSVNAANGNFTIHDKATVTGRKETERAFKRDGRKREYYKQKFNELNGDNNEENKTSNNKDVEN
jgi:replicative DNA helicase